MSAAELLTRLRTSGFFVRLDDDGRLCVSPGGRLFPEDREAIAAAKEEIVELLLAETPLPSWDDLEPWPVEPPKIVPKRAKSKRR